MANLTLAIDDEVLRRARIRALEEGTSVNALLRDYLERYSCIRDERQRAAERFFAIMRRAKGGPRDWKRDDLYDRKVLR